MARVFFVLAILCAGCGTSADALPKADATVENNTGTKSVALPEGGTPTDSKEAQTMELEISIADAQPLLGADGVYWLDCREQNEWDAVHIDGANLLPMSEISERVGELSDVKDQHVIVYCHHGGRSLRVTNFLRQQGFDKAQSMAGGIDQWSVQVDDSLPRY